MLVVVGRVGRAHGVTGEVSVQVRTDEPEARLAPGAVLRTDPDVTGPLTVRGARVHSGRLLLTFTSVADRTGAEALRGAFLLADVDADERPADPDEWYDHQLVGLVAELPDGTHLGTVRSVTHLPGHDLLEVDRGAAGQLLVPFVTQIVPAVDPAGGRLVIDPPPGLLDQTGR